ncbi:MAG TPA: YfbU family protein [Polyangia bacterium]|jgi:hypothetical protein
MSERFEMRVDEDILEKLDRWRREQDDLPSRAEAMRRLVEIGLQKASGEVVDFTDGEKLLVIMLRDIYKHLKLSKGEIDPDFVGDALWGGHTWALKWRMTGLYHGHEDDVRDVRFVLSVLAMWDHLERGFEKLSKKGREAVAKEVGPLGEHVTFRGFDGNNEAIHMGIAHFFVEKMDRFARFKGRDFNSHMPMIGSYRRMLAVFDQKQKSLAMGGELGVGEIAAILDAQRHPDSRG